MGFLKLLIKDTKKRVLFSLILDMIIIILFIIFIYLSKGYYNQGFEECRKFCVVFYNSTEQFNKSLINQIKI
jgi:uncharacterized membrane protein